MEIKKKERLTIQGENGCGKSTLMRILATLVQPTSGSFSLFGTPNSVQTEIRAKIGYIPETLNFDYSFTPVQLWKMMVTLRKGSNSVDEFRNIMKELKMKNWLDKPLGSFSLGMKKRTLLSLWISLNPQILFLDEFDSGLDENGRGLVEDKIHTLSDLTIVSITHTPNISLGKGSRTVDFNMLRR